MILIGSRALLFRAPGILKREPKDFDLIGTEEEIHKWANDHNIMDLKWESDQKLISENFWCEFEVIRPQTSTELFANLVNSDPNTIETKFGQIPNFDLLFCLKASHRYLKSPHFWKTALDYHRMKNLGAVIRPEHQEFLKLREKETYTYSHPKLNVSKKDFFNNDQITYQYDHDSIHLAMKHDQQPAYQLFQKDGEEVRSDKAKFFALPIEVKINSILEESYVLALERSQIPYRGQLTPRDSFLIALSKVCSSITSGWWREFAYEHIFDALNRYDDRYVEKFWAAEQAGIVKIGDHNG